MNFDSKDDMKENYLSHVSFSLFNAHDSLKNNN